jgi:hypothetical protein
VFGDKNHTMEIRLSFQIVLDTTDFACFYIFQKISHMALRAMDGAQSISTKARKRLAPNGRLYATLPEPIKRARD